MLYLYSVILLSIFAYWVPGLALFPQGLQRPSLWCATPFISAFVIGVLTTVLVALGWFTEPVVWGCTGLLTLIAFVRVPRHLPDFMRDPAFHRVLFFAFVLCLPYAARLGSTAFDTSDEISSWNFWAVGYYSLGQFADFSHNTLVPYPQLHPKFLAWCYHLLGKYELQLPLKFTIIWFSFSMLVSLMTAHRSWREPIVFWPSALLVLIATVGVGTARYFNLAYAEPLFYGSMLCSAALFYAYHHHRDLATLCALAICAVVSLGTKQPGMIWAAALCYCFCRIPGYGARERIVGYGLIFTIALWMLTEGMGFHDNQGVIQASVKDRNVLEQLSLAIHSYWIKNPLNFALFLGSLWAARRSNWSRQVWVAWLFPSLMMWFVFGAYELRLGIHIVLGMVLLCCVALPTHGYRPFFSTIWHHLEKRRHAISVALLLISGVFAVNSIERTSLWKSPHATVYDAASVAVAKYFENDVPWVLEKMRSEEPVRFWTATEYQYGIFHGRMDVVRPDFDTFYRNVQSDGYYSILYDLQTTRPDYAFTVGRLPVRGQYIAEWLDKAAVAYPTVFELISDRPNRYGYRIFKVNHEQLDLALAHHLAGLQE